MECRVRQAYRALQPVTSCLVYVHFLVAPYMQESALVVDEWELVQDAEPIYANQEVLEEYLVDENVEENVEGGNVEEILIDGGKMLTKHDGKKYYFFNFGVPGIILVFMTYSTRLKAGEGQFATGYCMKIFSET